MALVTIGTLDAPIARFWIAGEDAAVIARADHYKRARRGKDGTR